MSSIANPQPELPAEEELVAYLDGELPPEDCRRVEARLAADAAYRQQLHDLDQAWEALDALPATRTDDDFARTTMEMVAVAAEGDLSQHTVRAAATGRRRKWWLAAAALAAALLGFVFVRVLQTRGDAVILAELPIIRQLDLLRHIEDVEFLRRLPSSVPLDQLASDDAAVQDELLNMAWADAPASKDRRDLVEALSRDEKAELAAQANRFRALPRQERDRLRRLHQVIQDAADAQQLQQNLIAYGQWFSQLTLGEQEELKEALRGLPPDKQIDQLRQFIRQENRRDARQLSAEDSEKLRRAVLAIVEERRAALSHELQKRGASERARGLQGPRGTLMVLYWILQNEEASSEARERIVEALSPDARAHLEKLSRGGRRAQLWQWVRDSLRPKWGAGELEKFFIHELDHNQRERLLNLPPGEMQAELERLYVASELGFRGMVEPGDWPWHPPVPNRPPPRRDMGERGRRDGPPPPESRDRQRFERGPQGPPPGPRERNRPERRPPPPGPPPPDTRQNPI